MIGQKLMIRLVGTLTCVAAVAAGWDAEAARWHHRRACCETTCCDPCVVPVCTTVCLPACPAPCAPTCERVCVTYRDPCTNCCTRTCSYRVVESPIVVAAPVACCDGVILSQTRSTAGPTVAAMPRPEIKSVAASR